MTKQILILFISLFAPTLVVNEMKTGAQKCCCIIKDRRNDLRVSQWITVNFFGSLGWHTLLT